MSKPNQCCGLCTHYMTGGYACGENKTPITFPLYPTDGKICGQFEERTYGRQTTPNNAV